MLTPEEQRFLTAFREVENKDLISTFIHCISSGAASMFREELICMLNTAPPAINPAITH